MNESSLMEPSAHQPALFLIHVGIISSEVPTEIVPIIQGCKVQ